MQARPGASGLLWLTPAIGLQCLPEGARRRLVNVICPSVCLPISSLLPSPFCSANILIACLLCAVYSSGGWNTIGNNKEVLSIWNVGSGGDDRQ